MTIITVLNAHLAAGIAALLTALVVSLCESRSPQLARKVAFGGIIASLIVFVAALAQLQFQTAFTPKEIVVQGGATSMATVAAAGGVRSQLAPPNIVNSLNVPSSPLVPAVDWASIAVLVYIGFIVSRLILASVMLLRLQRISVGFHFAGRFRDIPFGFGDVKSPCVIGVLSPRIFLPGDFGQLPADQQLAVLHHERVHVQSRHSCDLVIREALRIPLGWFWPVRTLLNAHDRALEAECDLGSAKELGEGVSLARALVHFSSRSLKPAYCGLALVNAGTSLERRIHRLLSERKTMNINILTQITIATGVLAGAAVASQTLQVKSQGEVPTAAKEAVKLANLAVGRQWTYEYSWPGVDPHRFVVHAAKAIPVADGVVYELKKFSTSLKGTPMNSYSYMRVTKDGVVDTPNSKVSDATPGFSLTNGGLQVPSDLKPGKKWSWSAFGGVNSGGPATPSLFTGEVLPSKEIDTPLGKKSATIIAITEKVQWDVSTRVSYYVAGVGKVREELHRNDKIVQLLRLMDYKSSAPAPIEPKYIDTKPGR